MRNRIVYAITAAAVAIIVAALLVVRFAGIPFPDAPVAETAKSGMLKIGIEPALYDVSEKIAPVFSHYYPEASVELETAAFADLFNMFLQKKLRAVLVRGELGEHERSLLLKQDLDYRLEPVAKGAVVCIVNAANPVQSLGVGDLAEIYTGEKKIWDNVGKTGPAGGLGIKAYLNHDDIRLQQLLLEKTAPAKRHLTAYRASSDRELLDIVARDKGAVGVIPLSQLADHVTFRQNASAVRVLPLSAGKNEQAVMPTQYNVYHGKYPLGYIIFYMYRKGEALASGFGAWLADEGQKGFARTNLAPWKQPVRVIHLK